MLKMLHFADASWLATKLGELTRKSAVLLDFGLLNKNNLCTSNCRYSVVLLQVFEPQECNASITAMLTARDHALFITLADQGCKKHKATEIHLN